MTDLPTAWHRFATTRFYVVVHDVTPHFATEIESIISAFHPLVGSHAAAGVTPCWHGCESRATDHSFWQNINESFHEVLLHGYRHRNDKAPTYLTLLTGRADEFSRLTKLECADQLEAGVIQLADALQRRPVGFLPPAWQRGQVTPGVLARNGLRFVLGLHNLKFSGRRAIPLATWSWDWGRLGWLGHVAEGYVTLGSCLRPLALPTIAIHPADVRRGFLPRAVRICQRLLAAGRRPVVAADIEQWALREAWL